MTSSFRLSLRAVLALSVVFLASAAAPAAPPPASSSAPATTFSVNSFTDAAADFTNDSGFTVCRTHFDNSTCTLRAAIMNANRHSGGAIINLPAGTYAITQGPTGPDDDASGDLTISNTVNIVGAGAAGTIVDGGGLDRVFWIQPGATVTLFGLTVRNGSAFAGAGIFNDGQLTLVDSIISGNGSHTGGGFENSSHGVATLNNDTIENNQATAGGGLDNNGFLAINDSTIAYNSASNGGGLLNDTLGVLTVFNSTISNNSVGGYGGGLFNLGKARIFDSTIAGNLADDQALGGRSGGGLYNTSLISQLQLWNTLLAYDYVSSTLNECGGNGFSSQDYNFIAAATGCTITGTKTDNVVNVDPLLGPLANNGGPTLTRGLYVGSPAVDRIPMGLCLDPSGHAPVPDQRGVTRPVGPQCDIGAYDGALPTPLLGRNLVVNGDAEASAGSPNGAHVGTPGWPATQGEFTVVPYNAPGGFPSVPTDTVPANHGVNFFAGGNAPQSIGQQLIRLATISPTVDAGEIHFLLTGDLGGFGSQEDNAVLFLAFTDSADNQLGPLYKLGPVTAAQRGKKTGFIPVSQAGPVPAHARFAYVSLVMMRVSIVGPYNDGYADNISLVLLVFSRALFLPLVIH